jgi:hypothetical protein
MADEAAGSRDWRAALVREWLLLLLRLAVTHDANDEAAALAMADQLDSLGLQWRPSRPTFFRRTSEEVCQAITATDDPKRASVLRKHLRRIEDRRLQRAFAAAAELDHGAPAGLAHQPRDLWAGLRR